MLDDVESLVLAILDEEGGSSRWRLADRLIELRPEASATIRRDFVDQAIDSLADDGLVCFTDSCAVWLRATPRGSAACARGRESPRGNPATVTTSSPVAVMEGARTAPVNGALDAFELFRGLTTTS